MKQKNDHQEIEITMEHNEFVLYNSQDGNIKTMEVLRVEINKAGNGVSAHLPALDGFVIASSTVATLKKEIRASVQFHIEGLYIEERAAWMDGDYDFEFIFCDIPSLVSGYGDTISQSSLARIAGINESQMRQYVSGIKSASPKILKRVEEGIHRYAEDLKKVHFA